MIGLLTILALTSSCNIANSTIFCTSTVTSTSTFSDCGWGLFWPPYKCDYTYRTSISYSTNQTAIYVPPAWMISLSGQVSAINALGWSPSGWFEIVGTSKLISIPAYFAIRGAKRLPKLKDSMWFSPGIIGSVVVVAGLISMFAFLDLIFFSVSLAGTWIVSYPYLGKVQRSRE